MNTEYGINITLNLPFTQENIQFLLQKISTAGLTYLADPEDRKMFNISTRYFTFDQVILKMLSAEEESQLPLLHIKYQDTKFILSLHKTENKLIKIKISHFDPIWEIYFQPGQEPETDIIDFNRYIRLFLNILSHISLSRLTTYSGLVNNIQYTNQQCITILINMGIFSEHIIGCTNYVKESLEWLIGNGEGYDFIFFDKNFQKPTKLCAQRGYEVLKTGNPIGIYATKDTFAFKIIIKRDIDQGYDFISVYPIEPYCMKKCYGNKEETIDVTFYLERLLDFCENFAIYEIQTFL